MVCPSNSMVCNTYLICLWWLDNMTIWVKLHKTHTGFVSFTYGMQHWLSFVYDGWTTCKFACKLCHTNLCSLCVLNGMLTRVHHMQHVLGQMCWSKYSPFPLSSFITIIHITPIPPVVMSRTYTAKWVQRAVPIPASGCTRICMCMCTHMVQHGYCLLPPFRVIPGINLWSMGSWPRIRVRNASACSCLSERRQSPRLSAAALEISMRTDGVVQMRILGRLTWTIQQMMSLSTVHTWNKHHDVIVKPWNWDTTTPISSLGRGGATGNSFYKVNTWWIIQQWDG